MIPIRSEVDHARLAGWVEAMKGVYQNAIDDWVAEGHPTGSDLVRVKNHLQCLSMIQTLLREHNEMANSIVRDFGRFNWTLTTLATLIKPNGEEIALSRPRPKSMSLRWNTGEGDQNG